MSVFDALCNAHSETELFVLLCSLTHTPTARPLRAELVSIQQGNGLALELTIQQGMQQRVAPHEIHLVWIITHVFTLPAKGSLVWKMKDQPLITGLEAILSRLDRLRGSFDPSLPAEHEISAHA